MQLLVLADEDLFDERDVLLFKDAGDLAKAHAQLLHVGDHVQPGALMLVVVPVARLRVDKARLEQPLLVIQAEGGHGGMVDFCHLSDGD